MVKRMRLLRQYMPECERHGIPGDLVYDALQFANPTAMDRLSSLVVEKVLQRHAAVRARRKDRKDQDKPVGRKVGGIAPALVNWLIVRMIQRCSDERLVPPESLWLLAAAHLGTDDFAAAQTWHWRKLREVARYLANHPRAKLDTIHRELEISIGTASDLRKKIRRNIKS